MSTTTPNIGLILPEGSENVSRSIINTNSQNIDSAFVDVNTEVGKVKFYSLLSDLNLSSGATIAQVYAAMRERSVAIIAANDVAAAGLPTTSTGGYLRFEKRTSARGRIFYYHKTDSSNDYVMVLDNNNVPATWVKATRDAMFFFDENSGSSSAITSLETIPIGSWGRTYFNASTSPSGNAGGFNTLCFGQNDNYKTIIAITGGSAYFNTKHNGTWNGWKKFTVTNA